MILFKRKIITLFSNQFSVSLTNKPKGWVHYFSMQVVINKCFLLNPEKNLAEIRLVVFEKNAKKHTLIPKNDVTDPKTRRLGYSNNQLKTC